MSTYSTTFNASSTDWVSTFGGYQTTYAPSSILGSIVSTANIPTTATVTSARVYTEFATDVGNANVTVSAFAGGSGLGSQTRAINTTPTVVGPSLTLTPAVVNSVTAVVIDCNSIDGGSVLTDIGYPHVATFDIAFTLAAPTSTTNAATDTTLSSATLNGTVNPSGANASYGVSYKFQWGLTAAYGNETTLTSGLTGSSDTPVSAGISGLTGSTTYHFRVVAINADNTVNGSDMTFLSSEADPIGMAF